ncbi:hypothetical protein HA402_006519 [Bradysia odoriphaga]|nr:hypothetical protein HA402_006519 [Bradysia odoriphaga]
MVDFNLDDPLGDLLSDGSNDSFFETKPKTAPSKPATTGSKSTSKMEDLFGIKDETRSVPKPVEVVPSSLASSVQLTKKPEPLPSTTSRSDVKRVSATTKKSTQKETINFDDDDDPLFDLGFDPKNVKSASKKSNILDDLLGISEKIAVKPKTPVSRPNNSVSRQSTIDQPEPTDGPQSGSYISSVNRQRPSSIKRQGSATAKDPLGFFTSNEPDREIKKEGKPTKSLTTDWLGINTTAASSVETKPSEVIQNISAPVSQTQQAQPTTQTPIANLQNIFRPDIQQTSQLIATVKVDQENALQSLRQQETQLLIASQMKNQETMLMDMQKRQQSLLAQQEQNFNELLQKQLQRQSVLEDNIKRQQERINSHIQMLMVQPTDTTSSVLVDNEEKEEGTINSNVSKENVIIELSADVKKLELEKLRLEDLLQNIKTNHEQELEILEQSYKKQISLSEENMEKLENRLRSENKNLEEFYEKKIETLNEEKVKVLESYEAKIAELILSNEKSLAKVRSDYEDELKMVRNDHKVSIEIMRQSKLLEFGVVQENSSYLQTLQSASAYLESAGGNIEAIRDDLHKKLEIAHAERERRISVEEKKIEEQKNRFEKLKENTETERVQLLEVVKTLETKLNSISQTSAEEQWSLRQQKASLEVERTSFERERNFAREQIARDEKRIEDLKMFESLEVQRRLKQLDEDRQELLAEKAKFETMARLNRPVESTISRTEIDTAIKIAQDAARQSDVERERFMEMQRQFEVKRRELVDLESNIRAKEAELERLKDHAFAREKSAEASTKATSVLQQKLRSKLEILQQQSRDVMHREQNLSAQKLELSKERLELQSIQRKLYQSRCSLCKIGDRSKEISNLLSQKDQQAERTAFQVPNTIDEIAEEPFKELSNFDEMIDAELAQSLDHINDLKPSSTGLGLIDVEI